MRYAIITGLGVAAIGLAGLLFAPSPCEAGFCPTWGCYGSCGGKGCVCVTPPGEYSGDCYGVEYSEHFRKMGWKVSQ